MTFTFRRSRWNLVLLILALLPISFGGISSNYFLLLLFLVWPKWAPKYIATIAGVFIIYCIAIYGYGMLFVNPGGQWTLIRQFASFGSQIAVISLLFLKLPVRESDVMNAVLICGVLYSALVLAYIFALPNLTIANPYGIKAGLREYVPAWPQRYLTLLLLALVYSFTKLRKGIIFYILPAILCSCILVTFTRAGYLSVVIGLAAYVLACMQSPFRNTVVVRRLSLSALLITGVLLVTSTDGVYIVDIATDLYQRTVIPFFQFVTGERIFDNSAAMRLHIWKNILKIVADSPVVGTGFSGIYIFSQYTGSPHNQYLDVLLKMGIIGLMFYLTLWMIVLRHYYRTSPAIFGGLVSCFVFGFFHETTSLTYFALVFYLLVNLVLYNAKYTSLVARRFKRQRKYEKILD